MDLFDKLRDVSSETVYETAEEKPPAAARQRQACGHTPAELRQRYGAQGGKSVQVNGRELPIHMAAVPGGRRVPLLKTMLTTACERDCYYCPFRAGRNYRRATFKPEEMADVFDQVHRRGAVDGLFLSTGILRGGANTQNKLLDTAELLRQRYGYRGYLHLKLMPGAERGQVERAMQLADRVSVNLEAPNETRLARLAPKKNFYEELLQPLRWVEEIRRSVSPRTSWNGRWPSTTTQFVVGAAGENDLEILSTVSQLTHQLHLARAYFMAFNPVLDTPLENLPPEDPLRQHRLYQASFLLRDYGFDLEELPFAGAGDLPKEVDPKRAWAEVYLAEQPVELNRAGREALLRVPGIGPRSAEKILAARRLGRLREINDLRKLGIAAGRAAPFVLLDGARPAHQLALF